MKKFLLSMSVLAMAAFGAAAAEYTVFDIANPGEWTGDANGWSRAKDANGFTITTNKAESTTDLKSPADNTYAWRVYKGSTFTITSDLDMKSMVITYDTYNDGYYIGELSLNDGWTGTLSGNVYTCSSNGSKTFTGAAVNNQVRITKVVVSTEGGVTPPTPTGAHFAKVNSLVSGEYLFVINDEGTLKYGAPVAASYNYGRMNLTDATLEGAEIVTEATNAYTITVADGKATIKDSNNRFYGMDDSHFTSFQMYTDEMPGNYWTFAFSGDEVTFTNALNTDCIICRSKGPEGTWYGNIAPSQAPEEKALPMLYKKVANSGVVGIEAADEAPVYYTLQGVRVAEPANGIYIVVKGQKTYKQVIR